MNSEW